MVITIRVIETVDSMILPSDDKMIEIIKSRVEPEVMNNLKNKTFFKLPPLEPYPGKTIEWGDIPISVYLVTQFALNRIDLVMDIYYVDK